MPFYCNEMKKTKWKNSQLRCSGFDLTCTLFSEAVRMLVPTSRMFVPMKVLDSSYSIQIEKLLSCLNCTFSYISGLWSGKSS